jgi:hypothetical protein
VEGSARSPRPWKADLSYLRSNSVSDSVSDQVTSKPQVVFVHAI